MLTLQVLPDEMTICKVKDLAQIEAQLRQKLLQASRS